MLQNGQKYDVQTNRLVVNAVRVEHNKILSVIISWKHREADSEEATNLFSESQLRIFFDNSLQLFHLSIECFAGLFGQRNWWGVFEERDHIRTQLQN